MQLQMMLGKPVHNIGVTIPDHRECKVVSLAFLAIAQRLHAPLQANNYLRDFLIDQSSIFAHMTTHNVRKLMSEDKSCFAFWA